MFTSIFSVKLNLFIFFPQRLETFKGSFIIYINQNCFYLTLKRHHRFRNLYIKYKFRYGIGKLSRRSTSESNEDVRINMKEI